MSALARRQRSLLGALAALVLVALTVAVPPSAVAEDAPAADAGTALEVTDATFTWALNDEIGNAGFAPKTQNLLSAGAVPNPGRGGWTIGESDWRAVAGDVTIEKPDATGTYRPATFAGLFTTPDGEDITSPTDDKVSKIRVRIDRGTGWYDPTSGRAQVGWTGSFGVVSYSGLSFFNVSDIVLHRRTDGSGMVTGVLSGYQGSPTDPDVWEPVTPSAVVLADLPDVRIAGAPDSTLTLTSQPAYGQVRYDAVRSAAQRRADAGWGAWPRSFVRFQELLGTAEYWYSTGAGTDRLKVARPLSAELVTGTEVPLPPHDAPVPEGPVVQPVPEEPPPPSPPGEPAPPGGSPGRDRDDDNSFTVSNAQLRWGMSKEAGNAAHLPGTVNLLSAGELPAGSSTLQQREWRARAGKVRVEKRGADGRYRPATWAGLRTTPTGGSLSPASSDAFSDHQVVVNGGTGRVDPKQRTATIRWTGQWSAAFYSGLARFTVTDPELRVRNGRGRLLGTLSGYVGDREDAVAGKETSAEPVPPQRVVLADLGAVRLDRARGIVVTPKYAGVRYNAPDGAAPQVRTGPWGSFPASFVDFLEPVGVAGFWYSTGGSTDRLKAALPVTVSYRATAPIAQPKPGPGATDDDRTENRDNPDAPSSGGTTGTTTGNPIRTGDPTLPTSEVVRAAQQAGLPSIGDLLLHAGPSHTVAAGPVALRSAGSDGSSSSLPWALGTACLALAVALALTTPRTPARR